MLRKRSARAHRVAYEIFSGVEIPAHLQADHRCRVRSCVNPAHLELVTPQVNVARGQVGSNMRRRTHCPSGHPYDAQNTAHRNGRRHCRACDIARTRSRVV
jgi:hypothetical protein